MYDAMLKALTRAKVGMSDRLRREDRGQTAVEYLGIIVVVVAIVIAITGTDIGQSIKNAIAQKITELTGGGGE
ncbi:pilus assembly protein Flp/PilA [Streptomyces sp. PanSC19]|uniref:Flp family type IVb pilin n=1 Tax=Streptomyces sp. PanSC19 TaxID=1520455 RepID=UPI000F49DEDD|nr:Flp family type IVb pilin [Streptomyces sp. PanSC19]ROQ34102.1 pilus assembly protein Flp/PilA [Streptomyces sp. PanSC19]